MERRGGEENWPVYVVSCAVYLLCPLKPTVVTNGSTGAFKYCSQHGSRLTRSILHIEIEQKQALCNVYAQVNLFMLTAYYEAMGHERFNFLPEG